MSPTMSPEDLDLKVALLLKMEGNEPEDICIRGQVLKELVAMAFEAGYQAAIDKLDRLHHGYAQQVFRHDPSEEELLRLRSEWAKAAHVLNLAKTEEVRRMGGKRIVVNGIPWFEGDVGIGREGEEYVVVRCVSASGENTLGFKEMGAGSTRLWYDNQMKGRLRGKKGQ